MLMLFTSYMIALWQEVLNLLILFTLILGPVYESKVSWDLSFSVFRTKNKVLWSLHHLCCCCHHQCCCCHHHSCSLHAKLLNAPLSEQYLYQVVIFLFGLSCLWKEKNQRNCEYWFQTLTNLDKSGLVLLDVNETNLIM